MKRSAQGQGIAKIRARASLGSGPGHRKAQGFARLRALLGSGLRWAQGFARLRASLGSGLKNGLVESESYLQSTFILKQEANGHMQC
jgi:hypothetical protein